MMRHADATAGTSQGLLLARVNSHSRWFAGCHRSPSRTQSPFLDPGQSCTTTYHRNSRGCGLPHLFCPGRQAASSSRQQQQRSGHHERRALQQGTWPLLGFSIAVPGSLFGDEPHDLAHVHDAALHPVAQPSAAPRTGSRRRGGGQPPPGTSKEHSTSKALARVRTIDSLPALAPLPHSSTSIERQWLHALLCLIGRRAPHQVGDALLEDDILLRSPVRQRHLAQDNTRQATRGTQSRPGGLRGGREGPARGASTQGFKIRAQ
jgi:hypothetical protein